ncbi:YhbY family RNA-binding protein [Candidatus Pacearchaeota archaeon]|nr:YhbY family RNA-binding protein [Candidatus Pacearchaeota archaeon]
MVLVGKVQMGKAGLTDNFIKTLENHFKKYSIIKISVLKSCCRDREEFKKISDKILDSLGNHYNIKTIGWTLIVRKWKRVVS